LAPSEAGARQSNPFFFYRDDTINGNVGRASAETPAVTPYPPPRPSAKPSLLYQKLKGGAPPAMIAGS